MPSFNAGVSSSSSVINVVYSWGVNSYTGLNKTGGGSTLIPEVITSLFNWSKLSCGGVVSFGIINNKLYSWGENIAGGTGLNTTSGITLVPTQVGTDTDWNEVSAGLGLSGPTGFAIKANGKLYSWGLNAAGRTGLNTTVGSTLVPTQVGTDTDWKQVGAGFDSSLAIKTNNKLYSWGSNANGRTALNTTVGNTLVPTQVGTDSDWLEVQIYQPFGVAIKTNGKLYSWGTNANGRTGLNTINNNTLVPTQVGTDSDWEKIGCGVDSAFSIKTNGKLYSWGTNAFGKTALNTTVGNTLVPTQVGTDTDWKQVDSGPSFGVAIKTNNKLYSWGTNSFGGTGLNTTSGITLVPTQVGTDTDWIFSTAGNQHASSIKRLH